MTEIGRSRGLAAACMLALTVGCTMARNAPVPDSIRPTEATIRAESHVTDAEAMRPDSEPLAAEAPQPWRPAVPSRTAEQFAPFAEADNLLGARLPPSGLQRRVEHRDRPGPLLLGIRAGDAVRGESLPVGATVLGFTDSASWGRGEPFGIVFAPWETPVDAVRVLPETATVLDGVLRGLVRNWSRHLWAYEVTVRAGGQEFRWPLSVQPGEVAPFEIHGWDRPDTPEQRNLVADAEMSRFADPSRAFGSEWGSPELLRSSERPRDLPVGVRERFAEVTADVAEGSLAQWSVWWDFLTVVAPDSHPSLTDDIESLVVADLRAYGAVFDSHGRTVDIGTAQIYGWIWETYGGDEVRGLVDARSWPYPDAPTSPQVWVSFDLHLVPSAEETALQGEYGIDAFVLGGDTGADSESYDYFPGGFIVWIGAAHPARDVSAQ